MNNKAYTLDNLGKNEEAIILYDRALEIDPNSLYPLSGKGVVLSKLDKYDEALFYLDRALEIDPNFVEAITYKGIILYNMGKNEEALSHIESAMELESDYVISLKDQQIREILDNHKIPDWIRNNASWWVDGTIYDEAFVGGIQFLVKEGIIQIPETTQSSTTADSQEIPAWVKNNADWWSEGLISDDDFLKGIQFMVENGIITV